MLEVKSVLQIFEKSLPLINMDQAYEWKFDKHLDKSNAISENFETF